VYSGATHWSQQECAGGQDGSTWPLDLTFGLGTTASVDSIVIYWEHVSDASILTGPFRQTIHGPLPVDRRYEVRTPVIKYVPNDFVNIADAIADANPGDIVYVSDARIQDRPFTMKAGVPVERNPTSATPPVIDFGGTTATGVIFPILTQPGTVVSGF